MNTSTDVSAEIATLKVSQTQFLSFGEIVEVANLNNGYYRHLQQNEQCKNFILAPVTNTEPEEIVLYWEGKNQVIPGGADIYKYFADKGYEVIENPHPSLLVNAMKQLTEEKLTELEIPSYVDIVFPTAENSLLPGEGGGRCFLEVNRSSGNRELGLVYFDGGWCGIYAFLLRKKK